MVALLEDVFYSPFVNLLDERLLEQCYQHREFQVLSFDATIRCARRTRGQEDYRAPVAERNAALFGDADVLRHVLTVRGRTGAVLGMGTVRDESSENIANEFQRQTAPEHRAQCVEVFSDITNGKLFFSLKMVSTGPPGFMMPFMRNVTARTWACLVWFQ